MSDEWLDAMPLLGQGRWTVLLQSAGASWWAIVENGSPHTAPFTADKCDTGLPAGEPFAANAFDSAGRHARWLRGRGHGVSDHAGHVKDCGDCIETDLLLWGTGTGEPQQDGWSVMAHSRIGRYPVPAAISEGRHAVLRVHELLDTDGEGNRAVTGMVWRGIAAKE